MLDYAWTLWAPCFISFGPPGPYWSIAIAIPRTVRQTNSFQLQLVWRPSDWFMVLFSFPCVPLRINLPLAGPCDPHFIYLPRRSLCGAFLNPPHSSPTPALSPVDRRELWVSLTHTWHRPGSRTLLNSGPGHLIGTHVSYRMRSFLGI